MPFSTILQVGGSADIRIGFKFYQSMMQHKPLIPPDLVKSCLDTLIETSPEAAKADPGPARGHMLFTASFAGLVPNVGLGPYCVTKYGVVALAEVLHKELRSDGIGVSVLCPMRVATNIGKSERNRQDAFGGVDEVTHAVLDQDESNEDLAGRVLPVEGVGDLAEGHPVHGHLLLRAGLSPDQDHRAAGATEPFGEELDEGLAAYEEALALVDEMIGSPVAAD